MRFIVAAALGTVIGCSAPAPQILTGRIDPGFPTPIRTVKVTTPNIVSWHGDAVMAESPVAADGTFRLEIQPTSRLRLQLIGVDGHSVVVFPRQAGTIQGLFAVRDNSAPFDLGAIHFVGNAATTTFVFKTPGGTGLQCNNGTDPNGNMCVDDSDNDHNSCGQDGDNNQQEGDHQDGSQDEGDHQDGAQDGANDGEQNDDGDHQDEHGDPSDGPDMGDAVAEHNFPADGCNDHSDGGDQGDQGDGGDNHQD